MPSAVVKSIFCTLVILAPEPIQIPPGDSKNKLAGVDNQRGLLRYVPELLVTPTITLLRP
jgi:hypothetical protein